MEGVEKTDEKTVQPGKHGGWLKVGNEGCKGGTGRPSNEIRAASRESYAAFQEKLKEKLNTELSVTEITQAMNVTGKYGLGEAKVLVPDEIIEALAEVLAVSSLDADEMSSIIKEFTEKLKDA